MDVHQMIVEDIIRDNENPSIATLMIATSIGPHLPADERSDAEKIAAERVNLVHPKVYGTGEQYQHHEIDAAAKRCARGDITREKLVAKVRLNIPKSRQGDAEKIAGAALEKLAGFNAHRL